MSSFSAWGLTILGLAIVTTVAEMLLPHGKMRKVISSVFATITVFVIITPIPNLLKNGVDFDFAADTVQTDDGYLDYIESVRAQMFADSCTEYLKSNGYSDGFTISVESKGYTVKKVRVDFVHSGMTENGEHINKSELIGLIADYFGIGKEAVMSYG
ncbi:MAG: stage III sporulation protein AF [Clostridiales bacterium]|nr:stage III sporulation protein AF [Clostridiales bacterium]